MSFDEIMRQITSKLTGDSKKDIAYLKEQAEKYKDHEYSKEILRACGRLVFEILPDDKKEEVSKILNNDMKGIDSTLEEIRFNIYKKDYNKATILSENLIKKIEDMSMYNNDSVSEYYCFNEMMEQVIFEYINKPEKTVRMSNVPYSEIYLQHGSLLFEQKRMAEAREYLLKAKRWNPTNAKIAFEYIETYKAMGEIDEFFNLTKEVFKYAFKPEDIARCYRNLGYYFVEKELYEEAVACYYLSLKYDEENNMVQSELYYIERKFNKKVKIPSFEKMKSYAEKYNFPIGPDDDVIGIAAAYGQHFMESGEKEGALYFLNILYELTEDDYVKGLIDKANNL